MYFRVFAKSQKPRKRHSENGCCASWSVSGRCRGRGQGQGQSRSKGFSTIPVVSFGLFLLKNRVFSQRGMEIHKIEYFNKRGMKSYKRY